jgi:hypothetical protein
LFICPHVQSHGHFSIASHSFHHITIREIRVKSSPSLPQITDPGLLGGQLSFVPAPGRAEKRSRQYLGNDLAYLADRPVARIASSAAPLFAAHNAVFMRFPSCSRRPLFFRKNHLD